MNTYRKIRRPYMARAVRPEDWHVVLEKSTTPTQGIADFLKEYCGCWIKADAILVRLLSIETEDRERPWVSFCSPGIAYCYYSEPAGLTLSIALPLKKRRGHAKRFCRRDSRLLQEL